MPALNKERNLCEYISEYVDGEGCFNVSFSKRQKFLVGWETKPSFSVSQNEDRSEVLYLMKDYFGCGFIRRDFSDKPLKYEVRSLSELIQKVSPHQEGRHLFLPGLEEAVVIAFQMNTGGKRRYTQQEILKRVEMKI